MWLYYSIFASFLASIVNYFDKYLIEKVVKDRGIGTLILFSSFIGIPTSLLVYLTNYNEITDNFSLTKSLFLIVGGVLYLMAVFLYLKALQVQDVSSFVPQTLMIPAVSGLMGYFYLNETLTPIQSVGGLVLIACALKLNDFSNEDGSGNLITKYRNFILALSICTLSSLSVIVFKLFTVDEGTFWESIFWNQVGFSIFGIILFILVRSYRREFKKVFKSKARTIFAINTIGEILNLCWAFLLQFASLLGPLFLVQAVSEGFQPFFLLILGFILTKIFPKYIQEDITVKTLYSKIVIFLFMILGLILVYWT